MAIPNISPRLLLDEGVTVVVGYEEATAEPLIKNPSICSIPELKA